MGTACHAEMHESGMKRGFFEVNPVIVSKNFGKDFPL
jgi:hypothetical protein